MATHRRRRRSGARSHRRRSHRRRSNPFFGLMGPRRRRHHRRHRSHSRGRRRNPSLRSFTSGGMLAKVGGGAVGFLAARMIPQNLLPQYNTGFTGYALNAVSGVAASWLLGKVWNRDAEVGGYIGTGVAVLSRVLVDKFNIGGGGGMSGDLDFDLGYYVSDRFPFPQDAGGPFPNFPGSPYLANAPFAATSAAAVRAGQAAAAALPAVAGPAQAATPAGVGPFGRWSDSRWT